MANRRAANKSGRRNRRHVRQKKRRQPTGIRSAVTVSAQCIRSFAFYCPNYTEQTGASVKSWLESLLNVTKLQGVKVNKHVITGAVQSVFIGVEDVLFSSPLVERETKKKNSDTNVSVPCIDFRSARMPTATVVLTPGSAMKDRSGRYCAVLLPITEEEYAEYRDGATFLLNRSDSFEFKDLLQMPGARVSPFGRAISLKWRAHPTSYAYRFIQIGQKWQDGIDPDRAIIGGKPAFRLLIGFQDFASSDGNTPNLYSASSALLHADIRARVQLTEPTTEFSGRRYIRDWPQVTQDATSVTCTDADDVRTDVPRDTIYLKDGFLYNKETPKPPVPDSALNLDSMILE